MRKKAVVGVFAILVVVRYVLDGLGYLSTIADMARSTGTVGAVTAAVLASPWLPITLAVGAVLTAWEPWKTRLPKPTRQVARPAEVQPPMETTPSPPAAGPLVAGRMIVTVQPQYLADFFKQHLDVQAKKLVEAYIGKWIRVSGPLGNVYSNQVTFKSATYGDTTVFMYPAEGFIEQCSVLVRGQHIEVMGRIKDVNRIELHLEECELVTSPSILQPSVPPRGDTLAATPPASTSEGAEGKWITPEHLLSFRRRGLMTVEADALLQPFIGRRMEATVTVADVALSPLGLSMVVHSEIDAGTDPVMLSFDPGKWESRLRLLRSGTRIRAAGKINAVSEHTVFLDDCELIDA